MDLGLNKLPWYGQVGLFVVLAALAVAGFYQFYVVDVQSDLAAKQQTLAGLRVEIARGAEAARRLPEFQAEVADLEKRLDSLKAVLPDAKDAGELLRRLQTLATQSNLTIRGVRPQTTSNKQLYMEWPITLELDGTYHNLAMFFDRVGKVPRIINIGELNIRAKDARTADGSTITATCQALTFVLIDEPAAQAPPATP